MDYLELQNKLVEQISANFPNDFFDRKYSTFHEANTAVLELDVPVKDCMYGGYIAMPPMPQQVNLDNQINHCIVIARKAVAKLIFFPQQPFLRWERI